jgi:preprotein translocase subunit SecD
MLSWPLGSIASRRYTVDSPAGLRAANFALVDRIIECDMKFWQRPHGLALASILLLILICASCQKSAPHIPTKSASLEVYRVSPTNTANSLASVDPNTGSQIYLLLPAVTTSADVATVRRSGNADETPSLTVNLTPQGAQKLSAATTGAQGQQMAIVVNGKVISVAKVLSPLSSAFNISGGPIQQNREDIFEVLTGN